MADYDGQVFPAPQGSQIMMGSAETWKAGTVIPGPQGAQLMGGLVDGWNDQYLFGPSWAATPAPPTPSPPVVDNFTPNVGSNILPEDSVAFDVTDASGLARVILVAQTPGDNEMAWDGTQFLPAWSTGSTRVAITNGFRFTLVRTGDWPIGSLAILVNAHDTDGAERNQPFFWNVAAAVPGVQNRNIVNLLGTSFFIILRNPDTGQDTRFSPLPVDGLNIDASEISDHLNSLALAPSPQVRIDMVP